MRLTWLGHHSFKLESNGRTIYLDPYAGEYSGFANLILISKNDYDHFSHAIVKKLMVDGTHIIGTKEVASELYGCRPFVPGDEITFEDNTKIKAVKALIKRRNMTSESLGWLITIENKTLYFAGDTDEIPEKLGTPDIVLISVGGTWTMSAKKAALAVNIIKPKLAIPTHYGSTSGTRDDAELFKELVEPPIKVEILDVDRSITL